MNLSKHVKCCQVICSSIILLNSFQSIFLSITPGYLPNYDVDQMLENCRMMDMNKDSHVDLNEFLEAFRLCQQFKGSNINDKELLKENSTRIKDTEEECDNEKLDVQVDEYEISEMKECLNVGGKLKKSPSIRSVVSVDSLNQVGKPQEEQNDEESNNPLLKKH